MKVNTSKIKGYAAAALHGIGLLAGCAAALFLVWFIMWGCYYAGIPM